MCLTFESVETSLIKRRINTLSNYRKNIYTASSLKDICIFGTSEGNQVRYYSLRITPQNAYKSRKKLQNDGLNRQFLPPLWNFQRILVACSSS